MSKQRRIRNIVGWSRQKKKGKLPTDVKLLLICLLLGGMDESERSCSCGFLARVSSTQKIKLSADDASR